jgi:hypothetical protein
MNRYRVSSYILRSVYVLNSHAAKELPDVLVSLHKVAALSLQNTTTTMTQRGVLIMSMIAV